MLSETILEMPYCKLNLGKNKLEILPLGGRGGGAWSLFPYLGPLTQNKKGQKLRQYGLLRVPNILLVFSYLGETDILRFLNLAFCKIFCVHIGPKM